MSAIPVPPVFPPSIKQNTRTKEVLRIEENEESSRIKGIKEQCKKIVVDWIWTSRLSTQESELTRNNHWVLFNVDVKAKLQGNVPRCGLVALSMAAELARVSKESNFYSGSFSAKDTLRFHDDDESELTALFNLAKDLSFTSVGEMFSARNLATIAQEFYGISTEVTDRSFEEIERIIEHFCKGNPLLVPYDAAPNHEPCLSNGRKSHWALLTGFLCAVDDSALKWPEVEESCIKIEDDQNASTIHILEKPEIEQLPRKIIPSTLHFLARQSKSRHVAIWPLKSLEESNSNLFELNTDKENARAFVIPNGGVSEGLCKKLIYLNIN